MDPIAHRRSPPVVPATRVPYTSVIRCSVSSAARRTASVSAIALGRAYDGAAAAGVAPRVVTRATRWVACVAVGGPGGEQVVVQRRCERSARSARRARRRRRAPRAPRPGPTAAPTTGPTTGPTAGPGDDRAARLVLLTGSPARAVAATGRSPCWPAAGRTSPTRPACAFAKYVARRVWVSRRAPDSAAARVVAGRLAGTVTSGRLAALADLCNVCRWLRSAASVGARASSPARGGHDGCG